ncbi:MAG: DegV family protein [Lachnospiraceae bacterium]|nr:DegV family protein [Lachnospiraceae bacterium]
MRNFVITSDTNSDLPKEYIEKYGTVLIPQYYSFDNIVYGDEIHMAPNDFYQKMKDGGLPQSQANNPAVIEDKFREILDKGMDIIHIAFSSALSGSYNNVCMVANELLEEYKDAKITIIDSLTASLGESILIVRANELKEQGSSYDDIVNTINGLVNTINAQFCVNDMFHLARGGRISKTTAIIGSTLNLKPLIIINSAGGLTSDGTVRGKKKVLRTMLERMQATIDDNTDYTLPVGIVHSLCLEEAQALAELIKENTNYKNIMINDISPSIGAHTGPGALGLLYSGTAKPAAK